MMRWRFRIASIYEPLHCYHPQAFSAYSNVSEIACWVLNLSEQDRLCISREFHPYCPVSHQECHQSVQGFRLNSWRLQLKGSRGIGAGKEPLAKSGVRNVFRGFCVPVGEHSHREKVGRTTAVILTFCVLLMDGVVVLGEELWDKFSVGNCRQEG